MTNIEILKRLFKDYTKRFIGKILISVFFSILVAASSSMIAYLLDPAIEKIFIEKNVKLMVIIPFAILFAFTLKGVSLYLAKVTLIKVGGEIQTVPAIPVSRLDHKIEWPPGGQDTPNSSDLEEGEA